MDFETFKKRVFAEVSLQEALLPASTKEPEQAALLIRKRAADVVSDCMQFIEGAHADDLVNHAIETAALAYRLLQNLPK